MRSLDPSFLPGGGAPGSKHDAVLFQGQQGTHWGKGRKEVALIQELEEEGPAMQGISTPLGKVWPGLLFDEAHRP